MPRLVVSLLSAIAGTLWLPIAAATAQSFSTSIARIQGAGHTSALAGRTIETAGVVTAVGANGYWLQDPTPDASRATSEGLFVFTRSAPAVSVGEALSVRGQVSEFTPGGAASGNLSTTQLTGATATVTATGVAVPAATVIGQGGRVPPRANIDDDALGRFEPGTDGIDFFESLEGMRVEVRRATVVGPTSRFGEITVVGDGSALAGPDTPRGGIYIRPSDFNPERIELDDTLSPEEPRANVGDRFDAPITGVLDYAFGNYKLLATAWPEVTRGALERETAEGATGTRQLAVATYNVENLDPSDEDRFARIARQITSNLSSPDLLALIEIQDDNGATNDAETGAARTFSKLIAAISAAGGPDYAYRQIDPVDDQDGGEPGGNIRVGFLFRTDRGLRFVDRSGGTSTAATSVTGVNDPRLSFSPGRIAPQDPAFANSRKPLAGEFLFRGERLFVIANHFNSKGGDDPLFGAVQPPKHSSEVQRHAQAAIVNGFVDEILARRPRSNVIALGDFNDFQFSRTLRILKGDVMTNLLDTLPPRERYSYVFEGNSQALDHQLVTRTLAARAAYDVIHINAEFAGPLSDHDPSVAVLSFGPGT